MGEFSAILWGIYIALTAISKCSTLYHVEEIDDVGKKTGTSLLLGYLPLTRIIAQGLYWVSSTRISGRVNAREPTQGYFPCIEIKLPFLKCPSEFCGEGLCLFYLDQLIENIVGIFKTFCHLFI